jgi:hypothetical protein
MRKYLVFNMIFLINIYCIYAIQYRFDEIEPNKLIYIGNYQDYWIDFSNDNYKIFTLSVDGKFKMHVLDLNNIIFELNKQNIYICKNKRCK